MALTWAWAASFRAAPSIAEPITIILSTAFMTFWGSAPGMGFRKRSDVQSTSLMNGYAAAESLPAAAPIEPPDTDDAGVAGVIGFAFTTPAKSTKAAYAALASASFTVDIKYAGTLESTRADTELYTSIVFDSGTDAIMRPIAALIAVNWASEQTPLAGKPPIAAWWASAPALSNFVSMAAPMSIILPTAFAQATASFEPGLVE